MWVRLHALPIELYKAKVLKQIGEAIRKVLRIDTHTAMEARGKYTRLCVQVNVNKLLINTVLIGKFKQALVYEGINKLCFTCSRIGHKKEMCPHTIWCDAPPLEKEMPSTNSYSTSPHRMHEASRCEVGSGIAGGSGMDHEEDRYEPWMVVTRKRGGQKGTTKGVQQLDLTQSAPLSKARDSLVRNNPSNGNQVWNEAKVMGFTPKTDLEKAGKGGLVLGPNLKLG